MISLGFSSCGKLKNPFFLFVRAASFPNWKITPGLRDQNMLAIPAVLVQHWKFSLLAVIKQLVCVYQMDYGVTVLIAEYKGWSTSQWNAIVPASYSKIRYFFILQSLTTSKMRKFQTLKLSQFHKEKTCWTENWWSSGIMSNFFWEFFYVLGGKKFFKNFLKIFQQLH